eukprot:SAG31_NODE_9062_length_1341_cov_1.778583_2_plen_317_part_01
MELCCRCCEPQRDWDAYFFDLLARLVKNQAQGHCGSLEIEAWLPSILSRLTSLMHLPTSAGGPQARGRGIRTGPLAGSLRPSKNLYYHAGVLLAYSLGPVNSSLQGLVEQLLLVCQRYLHPSNPGQWSNCIAELLFSMTENIGVRIHDEREARAAKGSVDAKNHLREIDLENLTKMLQPILFLGMFSKSTWVAFSCRNGTKTVAALAPQLTLQPILDRLLPNIAVGSSHPQTFCACLSSLAEAMPSLLDIDRFPAGRQLLPTLLLGTVDGLDLSDRGRTRVTLKFYSSLLSAAHLAPLSPDAAYTASDCDAAISACL